VALTKVAVLRTSPETVLDDYGRLLRLVSYGDIVKSGRDIILNVDLSWHHYFPACSTAPWQVDGVLRTLLEDGISPRKIAVCINETPAISVKKGEILNRLLPAVEKHRIKIIHLNEKERWIQYKPQAQLKILNKLFKKEINIPAYYMDAVIIHLPTMKTCPPITVAGASYSAFKGMFDIKRNRVNIVLNDALMEMLALQKELQPAMFAVMDCTFAGEGHGPRRLMPHLTNFIAASQDLVTLDAVVAKIMGFDPLSIPFIRCAHENGLGIGDLGEVAFIGDDISDMNLGFQADECSAASLLLNLKTSLEGTVVAQLAATVSMMYDDWYWYIAVGEKRIKSAMKNSWGKLFETYRK